MRAWVIERRIGEWPDSTEAAVAATFKRDITENLRFELCERANI